eukprot:PhM_4_TR6059/c0_g1_i1/m.30146
MSIMSDSADIPEAPHTPTATKHNTTDSDEKGSDDPRVPPNVPPLRLAFRRVDTQPTKHYDPKQYLGSKTKAVNKHNSKKPTTTAAKNPKQIPSVQPTKLSMKYLTPEKPDKLPPPAVAAVKENTTTKPTMAHSAQKPSTTSTTRPKELSSGMPAAARTQLLRSVVSLIDGIDGVLDSAGYILKSAIATSTRPSAHAINPATITVEERRVLDTISQRLAACRSRVRGLGNSSIVEPTKPHQPNHKNDPDVHHSMISKDCDASHLGASIVSFSGHLDAVEEVTYPDFPEGHHRNTGEQSNCNNMSSSNSPLHNADAMREQTRDQLRLDNNLENGE